MVEPEVAFADIHDDMDLAEDMLNYVIKYALKHHKEDLEFLETRLENEEKSKPQNLRSAMKLVEKLEFVTENKFERLTYTQAIKILMSSKPNKKKICEHILAQSTKDDFGQFNQLIEKVRALCA